MNLSEIWTKFTNYQSNLWCTQYWLMVIFVFRRRDSARTCKYPMVTQLSFWFNLVALIARSMGPTWGPPGSCRPQVGPHIGLMNPAIWVVAQQIFDTKKCRYNPLINHCNTYCMVRHLTVTSHERHGLSNLRTWLFVEQFVMLPW